MGKAIVIGVVVVIIAALITWIIMRAMIEEPIGDLNLKQERQLRRLVERAYQVMINLGPSYSIEDSDVMSTRSQKAISDWLNSYAAWTDENRKEIDA